MISYTHPTKGTRANMSSELPTRYFRLMRELMDYQVVHRVAIYAQPYQVILLFEDSVQLFIYIRDEEGGVCFGDTLKGWILVEVVRDSTQGLTKLELWQKVKV